jgi:tRNA A-37 threonylcarbamoyl transferase component Bud32
MQNNHTQQQSTNTRKKIAKDKIIDYVAKFIRTKHYSNEVDAINDEGYEEMVGNLREFLQYLEDKNIINPRQLEDEKEVNNLIADILKLDLTKFKGGSETASNTGHSKKRSGSQTNNKDHNELRQEPHSHKRAGSERVSSKGKRIKDARHSDTPNAENLLRKNLKTSNESKRTTTIEHIQSQQSHRRANPSLEERKSTSGSINSNAIPSSKGRRAIPSLEKKSSKNSSKAESYKVNNSSRSSHKHHNSQNSEPVQLVEVEKSTKESANIIPTEDTTNASSIHLNESIVTEREKLINFIKIYTKRHGTIPPTTLDLYKFVKLIGKGAFGKVTLGLHKLTGKQVAIKTFEKSYMKDDFSRKKVFQEVYILKKIHHSNIIRLLEVFESSKHFFIVMEYAGAGDLLHYVKKKRRLPENEARFIFKQVLYGLGHCHCRSVLHRDIKLDNVLLDNEKGIKLCDFGVSKIIKKHQFIREQCGTPAYIAPEIIADEGYEGFHADLWSLGVVLYAMLCGTVPFKAPNMKELHVLIKKGDYKFPVEISEESKDLIRKLLVLNPPDRLSIPEVLAHPWVKEEDDEEDESEADESDLVNGVSMSRNECSSSAQGAAQNTEDTRANINVINVDNIF